MPVDAMFAEFHSGSSVGCETDAKHNRLYSSRTHGPLHGCSPASNPACKPNSDMCSSAAARQTPCVGVIVAIIEGLQTLCPLPPGQLVRISALKEAGRQLNQPFWVNGTHLKCSTRSDLTAIIGCLLLLHYPSLTGQ